MTTRATGPFDVKTNPQSEDKAVGSALGRLSLDIVGGKHSYDLAYTLPSRS